MDGFAVLFSVVLAGVLLFVVYLFTASCRAGNCANCATARASAARAVSPAAVSAPANEPVEFPLLCEDVPAREEDGPFPAQEGAPRASSRGAQEDVARHAPQRSLTPARSARDLSTVSRALADGQHILAGNLARAALEEEVAVAARAYTGSVLMSADDEARLAAADRRHAQTFGEVEAPGAAAAARAAAADIHALAAAHPEDAYDLIASAGALTVHAPSVDDVDEALAALRRRKGYTVDEEMEQPVRPGGRVAMTEADAAPGVAIVVNM